ncbi:MAG: hypothetical protein FWH27_17060 [Planctomycetaceae bacterium]|nr:hypothetical protein [Planctomycetaceae bacterium]
MADNNAFEASTRTQWLSWPGVSGGVTDWVTALRASHIRSLRYAPFPADKSHAPLGRQGGSGVATPG